MLRREDLLDAIFAHLAKTAPARKDPVPTGPKGRLFLSEYDIKKRLTPGGTRLTIPKDAIVSPLAQDWLTLKGISVVRE